VVKKYSPKWYKYFWKKIREEYRRAPKFRIRKYWNDLWVYEAICYSGKALISPDCKTLKKAEDYARNQRVLYFKTRSSRDVSDIP
jgi:hypothetical protein